VLIAGSMLVAGACVDDGADTSTDTLGAGADAGDTAEPPLGTMTGSTSGGTTAMPGASMPGSMNTSPGMPQPSQTATPPVTTTSPGLPTGGEAGAGPGPGQGEAGSGNLPDDGNGGEGSVTDEQGTGGEPPQDDDPFPDFPFPPFEDAGADVTEETEETEEPTSSMDAGTSTGSNGTLEVGKLAGMTQRHNELRAEVDTDEPIPPLQWDDEIAVLAQEWADTLAEDCGFEHSMRPGLGENLAKFGSSQQGSEDRAGIEAVDNWYFEELACYEYGTFRGTDSCSSECDDFGGCGHYTQVVWRETERVGCGVSSCQDGQFYWDIYVCNYDPPGNYTGELPY
jgi:pathogenesis-related protein 1